MINRENNSCALTVACFKLRFLADGVISGRVFNHVAFLLRLSVCNDFEETVEAAVEEPEQPSDDV